MFDLDNTLNNLQEVVINVFNERYGKTYTIDDFKIYNIAECINKEDAINMISIFNEHVIYDYVKPLPGAQSSLQKLIRAGHEIYIVTQSDPCIFEEKVKWIKYYFSFIDDAHIISMHNKWLFKCDIMIEDNIDNLLNGHHYDRICFDFPWNQDVCDEAYGIYRVHNFNEVLDAVNNINKIWSGIV
jgi:5'(3')-deoxyribonucleotidase